jgi:hypothetical protein
MMKTSFPQTPSEEEVNLAASLGEFGLKAIDSALVEKAREKWLKVTRKAEARRAFRHMMRNVILNK